MYYNPIISQAVYCGFGRCGSQGFAWWHYDVTEWNIELDFDYVCGCRVTISQSTGVVCILGMAKVLQLSYDGHFLLLLLILAQIHHP